MRVSDAALFERPIVITNTAYRFMVLEQLAEIGLEADVLLEPMRRDSGPAIAAGAAFAQARDKEAIVLALAADHVVRDTPAFLAACREGLAAAEAGHIVTFGVQPERAPRIVQHTRLDEVEGAEPDLFAGLEDQLHRAAEGSAG